MPALADKACPCHSFQFHIMWFVTSLSFNIERLTVEQAQQYHMVQCEYSLFSIQ